MRVEGSGVNGLEGDAADALADCVLVVALLGGFARLKALDHMTVAYLSPRHG